MTRFFTQKTRSRGENPDADPLITGGLVMKMSVKTKNTVNLIIMAVGLIAALIIVFLVGREHSGELGAGTSHSGPLLKYSGWKMFHNKKVKTDLSLGILRFHLSYIIVKAWLINDSLFFEETSANHEKIFLNVCLWWSDRNAPSGTQKTVRPLGQ